MLQCAVSLMRRQSRRPIKVMQIFIASLLNFAFIVLQKSSNRLFIELEIILIQLDVYLRGSKLCAGLPKSLKTLVSSSYL